MELQPYDRLINIPPSGVKMDYCMPNSNSLYQDKKFKCISTPKKPFLHGSCKHYRGHFEIIFNFFQYMFCTSYLNNISMYYILY